MTSRGWRLPARDRRLARLDRPVSREVDVVGGWKWCLDPRARATDWSVGTFEGGIRRQRRKNNKNEEREDLTYSRHVWRGASPTTLVAAPARAPSRRLTPGQSSNPPPRVTSPRDDAYLLQLNVVQLLIVGYVVVVKPVSFSISTLLSPGLCFDPRASPLSERSWTIPGVAEPERSQIHDGYDEKMPFELDLFSRIDRCEEGDIIGCRGWEIWMYRCNVILIERY